MRRLPVQYDVDVYLVAKSAFGTSIAAFASAHKIRETEFREMLKKEREDSK